MKVSRRQALIVTGAATVAALESSRRATAAVAYDVNVFEAATDRTVMVVRAKGAVPVDRFRATVLDADGTALVTLTTFEMSYGSATDGTWRSVDRVALARLGRYDVLLEVYGVGETEPYRQKFTQAYDYFAQSFVEELSVSPAILDFDHRAATITGTLVWEEPATRARTPIPGAALAATIYYGAAGYDSRNPIALITDDAGRFGTTVPDLIAAPQITVSYGGADVFLASGGITSAGVSVRQTRLTMRPVESGLILDQPAHIVVGLEMLAEGAWIPFAGQKVRFERSGDIRMTGTTGADGTCTFTVAASPSFPYSAYFDAKDAFATSAQAQIHLSVVSPTLLEEFRYGYVGNGYCYLTGRLAYVDGSPGGNRTVIFETAPPGSDAWTILKSISVDRMFEMYVTATPPFRARLRVPAVPGFAEVLRVLSLPGEWTPSRTLPRRTTTPPPDQLPRR
ncbi:MAG: hypothetical protein HOV79_05505 [Hamadaea sp.]|nr:hypothetical protein [Hamadaea sp.]